MLREIEEVDAAFIVWDGEKEEFAITLLDELKSVDGILRRDSLIDELNSIELFVEDGNALSVSRCWDRVIPFDSLDAVHSCSDCSAVLAEQNTLLSFAFELLLQTRILVHLDSTQMGLLESFRGGFIGGYLTSVSQNLSAFSLAEIVTASFSRLSEETYEMDALWLSPNDLVIPLNSWVVLSTLKVSARREDVHDARR